MARVYVSSTFSDLEDHRRKVYDALRSLHHDVIAMEDYGADERRPLERCLADVADCDLYVGIFAFQYGYIPPQGNPERRSITELEYRHAGSKEIPRLIFLVAEDVAWPRRLEDRITGDGDGGVRIGALREELQREHTVTFFDTADALAGAVSVAVSNTVASGNATASRLGQAHRADLTGLCKLAGRDGLPLVGSVENPQTLGVHPAAKLDPDTASEARLAVLPPGVPAYVERDRDAELHDVLGLAAERSVFVLVTGDSTAGKSRAAYEAMRVAFPDWRLFAPTNRSALGTVVDRNLVRRPCVVWLDNLEECLGEDGLTPARLHQLRVEGGIAVLATMRKGEYDHYSPRYEAGLSRDEVLGLRAAREVLTEATVIELRRVLSGTERDRAADVEWDPRVAEALRNTGFGLAEFLAAAPLLLAEWENAWDVGAHPTGAAIVAAAVEHRRGGMTDPISRARLEEAYVGYLEQRGGERLRPEPFEEGLEWATTPVHATSALLLRVAGGYQPFDYLVDERQRVDQPSEEPQPDSSEDFQEVPIPDLDDFDLGSERRMMARTAQPAPTVAARDPSPHAPPAYRITCRLCRADSPAGAKFCSNCGSWLPPGVQAHQARKSVSVLFTDVVDSDVLGRRLDVEPFARVLQRFFETAREALEHHDGVAQKYVGDAVMAVFGMPEAHEGDALRAVKAAVELHAAIQTLNVELLRDWGVELRAHTAIATAAIVVDEATREVEMAVDHTNLVASLVKLAEPGMILIDRTTYDHVRGVVRADAVHLPILGDSGPVFNVLGLSDQPELPRRVVVPMVGRDWELGWLRMTYEGVLQRRSFHLVSVLGAPGIGKTRLMDEFTHSLSRRRNLSERPLVLRGVCSPTPASTFSPLRQILRQAAGIRADAPQEETLRRLDRFVEGDQSVASGLAAFLELSGQAAEPEDAVRAICRALTIAAHREPLVLVMDDLHGADQPLLDAVVRIEEALAGVPVLLVAVSREPFDGKLRERYAWRSTSSMTLMPLRDSETEHMVGQILLGGEPDPEIVQAIVRETAGTPLEVEALMANLLEDDVLRLEDGRWVLTEDQSVFRNMLRADAAFAARIQRLNQTQRRVIVRAALIGMRFRAAEVVALLPDLNPATVTTTLLSLERSRDLLSFYPDGKEPLEPGDEAYQFSHAAYQQAAYDRLTLEDRMVLHEKYANWLAEAGDDSPTTAERIAFHFRQSHDSLVAFHGEGAKRAEELARRAGEWHARAGHGYITQAASSLAAVTRTLDRAIRLLPEGSPEQLQARLDLADILQEPEPQRAREIYAEVEAVARTIGHQPLQRHARMGRLEVRWYHESEWDTNADLAWLETSIREFEALGDATGWHLAAKAYRLQSDAYATVGKIERSLAAADRAIELARRTDDARLHAKLVGMKLVNAFKGPTPLDDILQETEDAVHWARQEGLFSLEALGWGLLARAAAMRGDFQRARLSMLEARQVARRRRTDLMPSPVEAISEGMVEMLCGNLEDAEQIVSAAFETEMARGVRYPTATVAALLARILLLRGRDADAEQAIDRCREHATGAQLDNQIKWRQLQAVLLARRGELAEAETLARGAVERSTQSEQPLTKAEALTDLADILRQTGKTDEVLSTAEQALRLYRHKGHMVAARETERLLDRIATPT